MPTLEVTSAEMTSIKMTTKVSTPKMTIEVSMMKTTKVIKIMMERKEAIWVSIIVIVGVIGIPIGRIPRTTGK